MRVWNGAHDDMFSKSSALPRHSFEEKSERKRDSVCECGRGSRREISRVFCEWSSPTGQSVQPGPRIHADGTSSDTNCCDRKGERAGSSMARRLVTWPVCAWSTSSHLLFFFFPPPSFSPSLPPQLIVSLILQVNVFKSRYESTRGRYVISERLPRHLRSRKRVTMNQRRSVASRDLLSGPLISLMTHFTALSWTNSSKETHRLGTNFLRRHHQEHRGAFKRTL